MKLNYIINLNIFSVLYLDNLIPSNYPDKYIFFVLTLLTIIVTFLYILFTLKLILNKKRFFKSEILIVLKTSIITNILLNMFLIILSFATWYFIESFIYKILLSVILFELILYTSFIKRAPSGITSEGIYVNGKVYAWFNIHDYYIDLKNNKIIFSSNIKGGLTLKGLTVPLKYLEEDTDKLKDILQKQNNKFLKRIVIR